MLPRPPACRGAVQKQLPTTIESIWVSDYILRHEWQRFVSGCRTERRFGSFVPGPLESRRRIGKRRMAHLSEAFPPPLHTIASIWSSFWGADKSQWQWQAPRDRKPQENDTTKLKASSYWWEKSRRLAQAVPKLQVAVRPNIEKDIDAFRERIRACQLDELSTICSDFNKLFQHSLSLGLLSESSIKKVLRGITNDLHSTFPNAAATHCLSFYAAAWDGLVACALLPIEQMERSIPRVLLQLVARLPMTSELAAMALSIISRLSPSQLEGTTRATCSIVVGLVDAWLEDCSVKIQSTSNTVPRTKLMQSDRYTKQLNMTRKSASRMREEAKEQAEELRVAETLVPSEIGQILRQLPQNAMGMIIGHGSASVAKLYSSRKILPTDIRYPWLLLVSELSSTKPVFVDAWRTLGALGTFWNQNLMSFIVLRHWISRGWVTGADSLEQKFRHSILQSSNTGFGAMISLVHENQRNAWMERGQLFKILLTAGQLSTIDDVFSQLKILGVKVPTKSSAKIVDAVSKRDRVLAMRILKRGVAISPEDCPKFVLSMIDDPLIHPRRIWAIVNVPVYGTLPHHYRTRFRDRGRHRISRARASLIKKMAVAFAFCRTRSPGVILRNVTQCLRHLRRYGAHHSRRLSRAVTHASVNLRVQHDRLVPEARADWALRMIQSVEGPEVAETASMIVDVWNGHKKRENRR